MTHHQGGRRHGRRGWRLVAAMALGALVMTSADAWAQQAAPTPAPEGAAQQQQPAPTPTPENAAQQPQAAPPPPAPEPKPQGTIDCGAAVGDRRTCAADTSAGVVLLRQSGEGTCALGTTWGFDATGVWVADGCRGTFGFSDDRLTVKCAAPAAGGREVCGANTAAGVALVSGSASCMPGKTWGYDRDGIWVSEGCQGSFVLTSRGALECGAADTGSQHCAADTSAGVVLAHSVAGTSCVLGQSWGYDTAGVWVENGCHAEFVLGNPRPPENNALESFIGMVDPYGRLRGHVAIFKDEAEVQDDASFIGLNFSTRGAVKFFATTEWGVSLVQGGQEFNPNGATSGGGYPRLDNPQAGQVFSNRIGNVGVDFGPFGRVAVGKQWSVHSDVTLYTTDQFVVFGSQATATYTAGTDGGFLATGRADQVLTYHNTILKVLRLGGQLQFRNAENSKAIDGAGASLQLTVLPGFRLGAAYTKTLFEKEVIASIRGLGGDAEFVAVGARGDWKVLEAAVVYAHQRNGDLARVTLPGDITEAIAFGAEGVEALLRVNLKRFSLYGGLNDYRPDSNDPLLDPNFRVRYGIAGLLVGMLPNMYAYAEARVADDSVGPQGAQGFNVLAIGVHYGFTLKGFHNK